MENKYSVFSEEEELQAKVEYRQLYRTEKALTIRWWKWNEKKQIKLEQEHLLRGRMTSVNVTN